VTLSRFTCLEEAFRIRYMGFQCMTVVLRAGVLIRLIGLNEKAGENKYEAFLSILPAGN